MSRLRSWHPVHSDDTLRFDPPRSSVTHHWTDRAGRERMVTYHVYHYFVPVDEGHSLVVTFGHLRPGGPASGPAVRG
jgi:hypothetical protein